MVLRFRRARVVCTGSGERVVLATSHPRKKGKGQAYDGWNTQKVLVIVKPDTVVRWHRAGFRRYWTWRSRRLRPGPVQWPSMGRVTAIAKGAASIIITVVSLPELTTLDAVSMGHESLRSGRASSPDQP